MHSRLGIGWLAYQQQQQQSTSTYLSIYVSTYLSKYFVLSCIRSTIIVCLSIYPRVSVPSVDIYLEDLSVYLMRKLQMSVIFPFIHPGIYKKDLHSHLTTHLALSHEFYVQQHAQLLALTSLR